MARLAEEMVNMPSEADSSRAVTTDVPAKAKAKNKYILPI